MRKSPIFIYKYFLKEWILDFLDLFWNFGLEFMAFGFLGVPNDRLRLFSQPLHTLAQRRCGWDSGFSPEWP